MLLREDERPVERGEGSVSGDAKRRARQGGARVNIWWGVGLAAALSLSALGCGSGSGGSASELAQEQVCAGGDSECPATDTTNSPSVVDTTAPVSPEETNTSTTEPMGAPEPGEDSPAVCGDVDAALVSQALGERATFLGTDPTGCGFEAGQWTLGARAEPYDPKTSGELKTSPSISGTSVPNQSFLNNDRSGRWQVHSSLVVDDQIYTLLLVNQASGSDTYPPADGEPQRPVTEAAAARLIEAIGTTGR